MKVLFLNNYDMTYYWQACQLYQEPQQHLWGVAELVNQGIAVAILPLERFKFLKRFSQWFPALGDLDQQLRVLWHHQDYDVIYSGHYFSTLLLAGLRSLGLFSRPIVAVVYQSPRKKQWSQHFAAKLIQGYDQLICINPAIHQELHHTFGVSAQQLKLIPWGCDLPFYPPVTLADPNRRLVLSTGRTQRDYQTLVDAFQQIEGELEIHGYPQSHLQCYLPHSLKTVSLKTVTVYDDLPPWQEYFQAYQRANVIAISVCLQHRKPIAGNGFSTFLDAIALGKPVVMTRNPYFGVDIEAEGIGLWAEAADPQSWSYAISYLLDNPAVAQEMGNRARQLCEKKYHLDRFSHQLAGVLRAVAPPCSS